MARKPHPAAPGHRGGISARRPRHAASWSAAPDPGFMPACKRAARRAGHATSCCRPRSRSAPRSVRDIGAARAELIRLRRTVADIAARARHGARRRLDPSQSRVWPDQRNTDKERYQTLTDDYPGAGAASGDQRHARPRRDRGRGPADRPDEPGQLLPAPSPGAVDQLAVLERAGYRPQGLSAARSPTTCRARARPRHSGELARLAAAGRGAGRRPGWSRTRPRSGGTSALRPSIRRWSCGSPTSAPMLEDALTIAALYQSLLRHLWRLRTAQPELARSTGAS